MSQKQDVQSTSIGSIVSLEISSTVIQGKRVVTLSLVAHLTSPTSQCTQNIIGT